MKDAFVQQIVIAVTAFAQQAATISALKLAWFERGYSSGGVNEIVADDLVAVGMTVTQAVACITLFEQIESLATAQKSILAVARRDI